MHDKGRFVLIEGLDVSDPPEIEVERSWVHSGEGYEAQLVCIVHGEPAPNVSHDILIRRECSSTPVRVFKVPRPRRVKTDIIKRLL